MHRDTCTHTRTHTHAQTFTKYKEEDQYTLFFMVWPRTILNLVCVAWLVGQFQHKFQSKQIFIWQGPETTVQSQSVNSNMCTHNWVHNTVRNKQENWHECRQCKYLDEVMEVDELDEGNLSAAAGELK